MKPALIFNSIPPEENSKIDFIINCSFYDDGHKIGDSIPLDSIIKLGDKKLIASKSGYNIELYIVCTGGTFFYIFCIRRQKNGRPKNEPIIEVYNDCPDLAFRYLILESFYIANTFQRSR